MGIESGFKTVECQIMDIADDVAYSTYDLEDALKTGFVTPMSMISALNSPSTVGPVKTKTGLTAERITHHVMNIWLGQLAGVSGLEADSSSASAVNVAAYVHQIFENLANDGAFRTALTSELVNEYVEGVEVELDQRCPPLSRVALKQQLRERVDVVKNLTYQLVVMAPNLKTVEYRGWRIVKAIFETLSESDGDLLLPDDYQQQVRDHPSECHRMICDFVAAMTDRYALEFFGRLNSEGAQTIFKPL